MTKRTGLSGTLGLLALLAMGAAPLTAQATLICSVADYRECNADGDCIDQAEDPADVPAFITIDRANEIVRAPEPRFADRTSPISTEVEQNGRLMLAGFQAGRAWSITYVEETGEMSLAISDPDAAILVFGRCLTHEETGTP